MVRATHPALYLTHARAFATHRCGVDGGARDRRAAGAAEREDVCRVCQAGRRRRGRRQQRGRTSVRGRRRRLHGLRGRRRARCSTTGLGPRGMRVRHCPSGSVSMGSIARGPSDHEHLCRGRLCPPLSLPPSPTLSLPDAGRSRADFLFGVGVALIGRYRPSTSHLLLLRGHVGQHLRRVASRWNPSVISAHSLPPLLASGAHSIHVGFRMVVCCLCIDLT